MSTADTSIPLVFGDYALEDRYRLDKGRVYLTGIQALVRLPMMQRQRDLKAGLNTGGFISGYRGSPLGMYDNALWSAKRYLKENNIHFQPGLNEDLAATSVWGSQQTNLFPGATVDGVFSIWYGKGPGRRSLDGRAEARQCRGHFAIWRRDRAGGRRPWLPVLDAAAPERAGLCRGDDPGRQSRDRPGISRLRHAGLRALALFGLLDWLQGDSPRRWKSGASVWVDPERIRIVTPTDFQLPPGGLGIRNPDPPLEAEKRLHGPKMAAVQAFVRANGFDRVVIEPAERGVKARIGIMTTGKAYLDTRQALEDLGLDEERCKTLGIRLYKVGMTWPLEAEGARRFAEGLQEVIVIEEKRSNMEDQLVRILYNAPADRRPLGDRQIRRDRPHHTAQRRRAVADRRRHGDRRPPAEAYGRVARAQAAHRPSRSQGEAAERAAVQGRAHAVLLLWLPAQYLDQGARRQPRHGRHRLPRHGDLDARAAHVADLPHGRRRRGLDRPGAFPFRTSTSSRIWATAPITIRA